MAIDELKKLYTALVDTKKGYAEAVEHADDSAAKEIFGAMLALRERSQTELHGRLTQAGENPSDGGSFMSAVHETAVSVRAAITGLGKNALGSFISGEEQVLEKYKSALAEADDDDVLTLVLRRQQAELMTKVQEMKRLADQPRN